MRKNTSGFTLVELLIVIVVIAILAAITLVAYNGIQERARSAVIKSDLSNIGKAIEMYRVEAGAYPTDTNTIFSGDDALIKASSFSTSGGDPYDTAIICSNTDKYLILASQKSSGQWYVVGSQQGVTETDSTGITGGGGTTCTNRLGGTGNYAQWIRTTSGEWAKW